MLKPVHWTITGALALSACVTRDLGPAYLADSEVRALRLSGGSSADESFQPAFPALRTAAMGPGASTAAGADAAPTQLPPFVLSDPGSKKFINSMDACLNLGERVDLVLSKSDVNRTAEMIAVELLPTRNPSGSNADEVDGAGFIDRARVYLFAYYAEDDGFISRDGEALKAGTFDRTITNEEITPVVAIFFEAIADELLQFRYSSSGVDSTKPFPVIKGTDGKYSAGKRPTVSVYEEERRGRSIDVQLVEEQTQGTQAITTLEYRGVKYVSRLVADNSELLSGLITRALGGVQIAFVFGVHFAFGDNDTLAEIVDTVVYVTTLRTAEAAALFAAWNLSVPGQDSADAVGIHSPAEYQLALASLGLHLAPH